MQKLHEIFGRVGDYALAGITDTYLEKVGRPGGGPPLNVIQPLLAFGAKIFWILVKKIRRETLSTRS